MRMWSESTQETPIQPQLTRQSCVDPRELRRFLKLSRHAADDTIKERLDSLNSHSQRKHYTLTCDQVVQDVVYAAWRQRSDAIAFCNVELNKIEEELEPLHLQQQRTVLQNDDLKVDPYAQKDMDQQLEMKYAQTRTLKSWIQNEREIEDIVQRRTQQVLNDSCGYKDWIKQFKELTQA